MLLGSVSGWVRSQESGKIVNFQTELRSLDSMLAIFELLKPTTILVELRRLPGVRSMHIDHHENVCGSARTCTSTRASERCRGKKTFIKHFFSESCKS